ncbi:MAG: cellulose synthase family protein [Planctomycetota bacterium]|jgi:cellulose synthase/poly-beta-1,6-N-acetylglucosamine synthase-like glycosyltransferase
MKTVTLPFLIYYTAVFTLICVYGAHRYWVVWLFLRNRRRRGEPQPPGRYLKLPPVTVQLPMFNERHVAQRIIEAACAIDYPRDLLQVQVLDDSTDESAEIARRCCQRMAAAGHNVQFLHRVNRHGFKAGALAHGLESAQGEFIAVFDADFVPPPDVLRQTIHYFTDPRLGMAQLRWTHLNRNDSLLTQIQAMYLDGHFVIEQTARARSGRWFNFNGTAGMWRRSCIEDAGGWQHDTLTEDTDLSYRAQLKGWRFLYVPTVTCPAEVPPTVSAFLTQQHRWNKGLIQTARKLLPRIITSRAPLKTKIEAWFHLTSPLVHLAIVLMALLIMSTLLLPSLPQSITPNPHLAFGIGMLFVILGTMAACTFYLTSQWTQGMSFWHTLARLPALMAIGIGISVTNAKAVLEAMVGKQSPFVRTPKYAGATRSAEDPLLALRRRLFPAGSIEIVLGVIMTLCFLAAFLRPHTLVGAPFLLLFACGYLGIGLPSFRQARERQRSRARAA